jgi:hypothetical protein
MHVTVTLRPSKCGNTLESHNYIFHQGTFTFVMFNFYPESGSTKFDIYTLFISKLEVQSLYGPSHSYGPNSLYTYLCQFQFLWLIRCPIIVRVSKVVAWMVGVRVLRLSHISCCCSPLEAPLACFINPKAFVAGRSCHCQYSVLDCVQGDISSPTNKLVTLENSNNNEIVFFLFNYSVSIPLSEQMVHIYYVCSN